MTSCNENDKVCRNCYRMASLKSEQKKFYNVGLETEPIYIQTVPETLAIPVASTR